MVLARFSSPFAPLMLTLDEKEDLARTAGQIIAETMAMYENFLWQDRERLDSTTWNQVRQREDMPVYHNKRPGAGTGHRDMHLLLAVGSVRGTLNDAMYGVLNSTTETMRIKTEYVQDTLLDMAVLESIVQPTPELPFESMTTTGIRQLSNGERVGIHLMHSVSFDKTPTIPQYDRFIMALCAVWRQLPGRKVQCFMTSHLELKESFKTKMVIMSMADACLSVWKAVSCAQLKKLAWLVQHKRTVVYCERNTAAPEDYCSVCGSQDRSARRGLKSSCAVCAKYTCRDCRVKRDLRVFAPDGELLKHHMRFCIPCLMSADRLDASDVAANEASTPRGKSHANRMHVVASTSMSSTTMSAYSGDDMCYYSNGE